LGRTVALIHKTAYWTSYGGALGVNKHHWHSAQPRLVNDELPKLVECPRGESSTLVASNGCPSSNALKVLKGNTKRSCLSLCYYPLGYTMIDIGHKAMLLLRELLKKSFCRLCALRLQSGSKFPITLSEAVDLPADEHLTVTRGSSVNNAEVNAQEALGIIRRRLLDIASSIEKELTFIIYQIRLALACLKQFSLVFATGVGNTLPTSHSPNTDSAIGLVSQNAVIIGNSTSSPEDALRLAVEFVSVGDFRNSAYHYLGG